jgi:hypothetical protein
MARVRRGPGGEADADAAIVAELKEGKEHPASKARDGLKKIVKWVSWQDEPAPLTQKAGASRLFDLFGSRPVPG